MLFRVDEIKHNTASNSLPLKQKNMDQNQHMLQFD